MSSPAASNLFPGSESLDFINEQPLALGSGEVARISSHYDIIAYGATHGMTTLGPEHQPTSRDYGVAKHVGARLRPGIDTLVVEAYGHTGQPSLYPTEERLGRLLESSDFGLRVAARAVQEAMRQDRIKLEQERVDGSIDAFTYMRDSARLSGVRVVYGDYTAEEAERLERQTGKHIYDVTLSDQPEDRELAVRVHAGRGVRIANTAVQWALDNLPAEGDTVAVPSDGKPRIVILDGRGHLPEIEDSLEASGVQFSAHDMGGQSSEERVAEYELRAAGGTPIPVDVI